MSMLARKIQVQEQQQQQPKKRFQVIRTRITTGEKVIAGFIAIFIFAMLSLIVHNYASIYSTNKDIHQLHLAIGAQTETNEGLTQQVVELSAPDRILGIASKELGMSLDDNKVKVVQN